MWFGLSYYAPHRQRLRRSIAEFDRRFGVDTGGFEWVSRFETPAEISAHAKSYGPVRAIDGYLRSLGISFDGYTFVDYGCGKGRALLMASDFPFREILGVEYVAALAAIARRNVTLYRNAAQKCDAIRVIDCDASVFDPPATPTVFFMYNPFDEVVLNQVLSRIRNVHAGTGTTNYLIYCDPEHRACIEADPVWEVLRDQGSWVSYRTRCTGRAERSGFAH